MNISEKLSALKTGETLLVQALTDLLQVLVEHGSPQKLQM